MATNFLSKTSPFKIDDNEMTDIFKAKPTGPVAPTFKTAFSGLQNKSAYNQSKSINVGPISGQGGSGVATSGKITLAPAPANRAVTVTAPGQNQNTAALPARTRAVDEQITNVNWDLINKAKATNDAKVPVAPVVPPIAPVVPTTTPTVPAVVAPTAPAVPPPVDPLKVAATQTATEMMAGATPGFDQQASITREAQRVQQALAEKQKREAFLNAGMAGTGKYLQNEIGSINQNERERIATERGLTADKMAQAQQNRVAGLGAANTLLGQASSENIAKAGIASTEKLAGWDISQDQWKTTKLEDLTRAGWSHDDAQAQVDRDWKTKEAEAVRGFTTTERISSEQYANSKAYLDAQIAESKSVNDFARTQILQDQSDRLALKMQYNDMTHDESMAKLNADIATAKADGDVGRSKSLMSYQADIDIDKQEREFGHDVAMTNLDGKIKEALQNNDYDHANILQDKKIAAESAENNKTIAIQTAELALRKAGIDVANIQLAIDAGVADPATLSTWLKNNGINIDPPDPFASAKAAKEKRQLMFNEWASTNFDAATMEENPPGSGNYKMKDVPALHKAGDPVLKADGTPEMVTVPVTTLLGIPTGATKTVIKTYKGNEPVLDKDGKPVTTTPLPAKFNDVVNESLTGEKSGISATAKLNELSPADLVAAATDPKNPNNKDYLEMVKNAPIYTVQNVEGAKTGLLGNQRNTKISNPPLVGTSMMYNGKPYMVVEGVKTGKQAGPEYRTDTYQYFTVIDPTTGQTMEITSGKF